MKKYIKQLAIGALLITNTYAFQNNSFNLCDNYCKITQNIKKPQKRAQALDDLLDLAINGDARAKTKIGEIFVYGEYGVKRKCRKGLFFLLSALSIKKGKHKFDPNALKVIANMFKYGICVKKDEKKYKKYLKEYFKEKQKVF